MACSCDERRRPLQSALPVGSNRRPRQWFVLRRNWTRSAFTGYRVAWSASSDICCRVCGSHWRSSASWVADLPDCEYWPERHYPREERLSPDA